MNGHYILVGTTPVEVDLMTWATNFSEGSRRVAKDTVNGAEISTVFLGLDHQFSPGGPPLVFETMVFGGALDQYCARYSTWEQAEEGHRAIVERVKTASETYEI